MNEYKKNQSPINDYLSARFGKYAININKPDADKQYNECLLNYRITRVNIDSRNRIILSKNIFENNTSESDNYFSFSTNSSIITINVKNHGFAQNDKISITNVSGEKFNLRSFEFIKNSPFVKIFHPNHKMKPFNKQHIYMDYTIEITDIDNGYFIKNIPVNTLNTTHYIYFNTNNSDIYDENYYYIKINILPDTSEIFNVKYCVIYKHLCGIPLNFINANYPVGSEYATSNHIINSVIDDNTFTINVNFVANCDAKNYNAINSSVNRISNILSGHLNNNSYTISLDKTFNNVKMIRLLSSEIPNTEKVIKDYPSDKQNNLFYWQILNDGPQIYSIAIFPGNYTAKELSNEMSLKINDVSRIVQSNEKYYYESSFSAETSICMEKSLFTITFYSTITINDPFTISHNSTTNTTLVEITHHNHLLKEKTKINISNSLSIDFIPENIINGFHEIYEIIDNDKYTIKLKRYNKLSPEFPSKGGNAVNIKFPLYSQLLFDRPGTIGNILGFRDVGISTSVTGWNYTNANNLPYYNENTVPNSVINNYINLSGENYIYMTCPLFRGISDLGNIKGIFAKLQLFGRPGTVIYNKFVQCGEIFAKYVSSLSELEIEFVHQDGSLVNFYNMEHSFTMEIYEYVPNIIGIGESSKTDKPTIMDF